MHTPSIDTLRVPYGLAVHGDEEVKKVLAVLQEHRTNTGKETQEFETKATKYFGKKYGIMVNSGSSANLLALELANLPEGNEVITPLLTFSTTVSPIIKKKLIPVFVDVQEGTYVIDTDQIEKLITKKTKALMIPLLLGNVPQMDKLRALAKAHNLLFIEDSCDTFGAQFKNKPTGSYTDITTTSFFGSHIITAGGNGGMIMVNTVSLRDRAKLLRGWGRSSSLFGESEDIVKRFKTAIDTIPYDAKFIFSDTGYNFLPNEMGSAFGNAQLNKLEIFRRRREKNFKTLYDFFAQFKSYFILPVQSAHTNTQWLAFPLTITSSAPFSRIEIVTYLEKNNIQTRPVFTGNILRQPGFKYIPHRKTPNGYPVTNAIMERGFLIGCHHGIEQKHLEKIKEVFKTFLNKYSKIS